MLVLLASLLPFVAGAIAEASGIHGTYVMGAAATMTLIALAFCLGGAHALLEGRRASRQASKAGNVLANG